MISLLPSLVCNVECTTCGLKKHTCAAQSAMTTYLHDVGRTLFAHFVGAPCKVGPLEPSLWAGHPSHTMERRGQTATCTRCGGKAKFVEGEARPHRAPPQALCSPAIKGFAGVVHVSTLAQKRRAKKNMTYIYVLTYKCPAHTQDVNVT